MSNARASRRRRRKLARTGGALAVAVLGLVGAAVVTGGPARSDATARRDAVTTTTRAALGAFADGMGAAVPTTVATTTTLPPIAPPAPPPPPLPDPLVAPDSLRAEVDGLPPVSRLSRAEVIAGEPAGAPGHWGVYEMGTNRVWIGSGAFGSPERLRYVVAHEVGHAWYYRVATAEQRARLNAAVASSGQDASERVADCIAIHWGATISHYWPCPEPARAAVGTILAGG